MICVTFDKAIEATPNYTQRVVRLPTAYADAATINNEVFYVVAAS